MFDLSWLIYVVPFGTVYGRIVTTRMALFYRSLYLLARHARTTPVASSDCTRRWHGYNDVSRAIRINPAHRPKREAKPLSLYQHPNWEDPESADAGSRTYTCGLPRAHRRRCRAESGILRTLVDLPTPNGRAGRRSSHISQSPPSQRRRRDKPAHPATAAEKDSVVKN